ncbi:NAD-dependent epimerase/dehydratase family protein [Dyadobacter alkalitolerans]|uniref:NAD-dependent epimerase/dehydratase family protein n=1 Tax=Dyadobacter alkalitolerans TaxID=492736 RepID=UPI0003F92862|nr:SDR family oxidoreductase [Dyadobacter alkalitolerans]
MKVLVIGARGFIGQHVYDYFNNKPVWEVWSCDVVVDYTTLRYIQIDASNSDFTEIFNNNHFDICINCSGAASVPDSLTNPQRDFLLNTYNVFRMLDAIRKHDPTCKFINLSSAAVYGNPLQLPISESVPLSPISPYGRHKLMAESICKEYAEFFGVSTCSLRIFSAYGEGLKKQLLWDLFNKMKNGTTIQLFGNGSETRDFIHVEDVVHTIDLVISNARFEGEVINVANGEEIEIRYIVELFGRLMNWQGQIDFSCLKREGDPCNWQADMSIMKSYHYKPSMPFEEGVAKYIKWVRESI